MERQLRRRPSAEWQVNDGVHARGDGIGRHTLTHCVCVIFRRGHTVSARGTGLN
jgi:hypothetical protein